MYGPLSFFLSQSTYLCLQEKLRIAYEQEIVRVYTRGARAAANQETPLSVCTILKDKEAGTVYHPFNALKVRRGRAQL